MMVKAKKYKSMQCPCRYLRRTVEWLALASTSCSMCAVFSRTARSLGMCQVFTVSDFRLFINAYHLMIGLYYRITVVTSFFNQCNFFLYFQWVPIQQVVETAEGGLFKMKEANTQLRVPRNSLFTYQAIKQFFDYNILIYIIKLDVYIKCANKI